MIQKILSNPNAHICALIGFIFLIISTQVKNKKEILFYQSLFSFFFFLQYILLNIYSASILCLFSIIRNIAYNFNNKKINNIIIILTIIIGIITGLYDANNYNIIIAFLPTIIHISYSIVLKNNKTITIKKIFLLCSIIWIIYDYLVGASIGLICNTFEMISYLYYFKRKRQI